MDRNQVYETPGQAVNHILLHEVWSKDWQFGEAFGRTVSDRRKIDSAIKENRPEAFKAAQRRGYWRIELA